MPRSRARPVFGESAACQGRQLCAAAAPMWWTCGCRRLSGQQPSLLPSWPPAVLRHQQRRSCATVASATPACGVRHRAPRPQPHRLHAPAPSPALRARAQLVCVHLGAAVGFYSGNVLELLDDIAVLKPHVFVSVPRLWNRIYDRVRRRALQRACHAHPSPGAVGLPTAAHAGLQPSLPERLSEDVVRGRRVAGCFLGAGDGAGAAERAGGARSV